MGLKGDLDRELPSWLSLQKALFKATFFSAAFWVAAMCQTQYAHRHRLKERGRKQVVSPRAWSQMQSLEQVHRRLFPQGSTFCTSLCILEGAVLKHPNRTLFHPMIIKSKFPCINRFSDAKSTFLGTG